GLNIQKDDLTNVKVIDKNKVRININGIIKNKSSDRLNEQLSDGRTIQATVEAMKRSFKQFWQTLDAKKPDLAWQHLEALQNDAKRLKDDKNIDSGIKALKNIRFESTGDQQRNGLNIQKDDLTNVKVIDKYKVRHNIHSIIVYNYTTLFRSQLSDGRTIQATVEAMKRSFKQFWQALDVKKPDLAWQHL